MEHVMQRGYFKFPLTGTQRIDEGQLILANKKSFLLPCGKDRYDERLVLYRVGEGKIPLGEYLEKNELTFEAVQEIVLSILDIYRRAKDEELSAGRLGYHCGDLFIQETTRKLQWMYVPVTGSGEEDDLAGLLTELAVKAKCRGADSLRGLLLGYAVRGGPADPDAFREKVRRQKRDGGLVYGMRLKVNLLLGTGLLLTALVYFGFCFGINAYGWDFGITVIVTWSSLLFYLAGAAVSFGAVNLILFFLYRPFREKRIPMAKREADEGNAPDKAVNAVAQEAAAAKQEKEQRPELIYNPVLGREEKKRAEKDSVLTVTGAQSGGTLPGGTLHGTISISLAEGKEPFLLRKGQDPEKAERIVLTGRRCTIGREKGGDVTCTIAEPVISRRHAIIEEREGGYFISDWDSKNHTYVNGKILAPGEKRKLEPKDTVSFGRISYFFIWE